MLYRVTRRPRVKRFGIMPTTYEVETASEAWRIVQSLEASGVYSDVRDIYGVGIETNELRELARSETAHSELV